MSEITFANLKVEDDEFNNNSIADLADRPNASATSGANKLSAKQLKERFDANPDLIRTRFNELLKKNKEWRGCRKSFGDARQR